MNDFDRARIKNYGEDQPFLLFEWFTIDTREIRTFRRVMGLWEVVAKVGGIVNVFKILFAYLFNKYALINFKVHIINQFYKASSDESVLKYDEEDNVKFSTCDKFRLMVNLCPNRRL